MRVSGPGRLLPYPKPITVKPGSFGVLATMAPATSARRRGGDGEWQVPVGEGTGRRVGTPCGPGFVIVPRYDPGRRRRWPALSETEAFFSLALHAVNLLPHGPAGPRRWAGCRGRECSACLLAVALSPTWTRPAALGARPRRRAPGI